MTCSSPLISPITRNLNMYWWQYLRHSKVAGLTKMICLYKSIYFCRQLPLLLETDWPSRDDVITGSSSWCKTALLRYTYGTTEMNTCCYKYILVMLRSKVSKAFFDVLWQNIVGISLNWQETVGTADRLPCVTGLAIWSLEAILKFPG